MSKKDLSLVEALEEEREGYRELKRTAKDGRVDFLKHKDQIQMAFDKGYSARKIWSMLSSRDEIKIGYRRFSTYFQEYITGDKIKKSTTRKGGVPRSSISETQRTENPKIANKTERSIDKPKDKPKVFVYNATPKKGLV